VIAGRQHPWSAWRLRDDECQWSSPVHRNLLCSGIVRCIRVKACRVTRRFDCQTFGGTITLVSMATNQILSSHSCRGPKRGEGGGRIEGVGFVEGNEGNWRSGRA